MKFLKKYKLLILLLTTGNSYLFSLENEATSPINDRKISLEDGKKYIFNKLNNNLLKELDIILKKLKSEKNELNKDENESIENANKIILYAKRINTVNILIDDKKKNNQWYDKIIASKIDIWNDQILNKLINKKGNNNNFKIKNSIKKLEDTYLFKIMEEINKQKEQKIDQQNQQQQQQHHHHQQFNQENSQQQFNMEEINKQKEQQIDEQNLQQQQQFDQQNPQQQQQQQQINQDNSQLGFWPNNKNTIYKSGIAAGVLGTLGIAGYAWKKHLNNKKLQNRAKVKAANDERNRKFGLN